MTDLEKLGAGDRDMNERKNDNPQERGFNDIDKSVDDFVPEDAWPVCPRCFTPCPPWQYYCPHCNSNDAINPLTPYIAFLNIRFNYDIFCTMWRKIWYDKHTSMMSRLIYLLMVSAFVPVFVVVGLPLLFIKIVPRPELRKSTTILLCIIAMIFFFAFFVICNVAPS